MTACLDSWAVLAWLAGDEPARSRVRAALDDAVLSWINLAEVYYCLRRLRGEDFAEKATLDLRGALKLDPASPQRTMAAARLKAVNPISLADCFAVATAIAFEAPLLTGDPEIIDRPGLGCRVEDLRA